MLLKRFYQYTTAEFAICDFASDVVKDIYELLHALPTSLHSLVRRSLDGAVLNSVINDTYNYQIDCIHHVSPLCQELRFVYWC